MIPLLAFFPSHWFLIEPREWVYEDEIDKFIESARKETNQ